MKKRVLLVLLTLICLIYSPEKKGISKLTPKEQKKADNQLRNDMRKSLKHKTVKELAEALEILIEYDNSLIKNKGRRKNKSGKQDSENVKKAFYTLSEAIKGGKKALPFKLKEMIRAPIVPKKNQRGKHNKYLLAKTPLEVIKVCAQNSILRNIPPEKVQPHPAADTYPFKVPSNTKIIKKSMMLNSDVPKWHTTGLYAPPGKLITVEIPSQAVNKGLTVRIGAHKDKLYHKEKLFRFPEITRTFELKSKTTEAANAFGGAIYIVFPKQGLDIGKIKITITGGVQAPCYILGKTSLKEWKKKIRNYPGPWAEMVTTRIIVSVPSYSIRKLDQPDEVMKIWDRMIELEDELIGWEGKYKPTHPCRIVPDIQISAGAQHAGYPVMAGGENHFTRMMDIENMNQLTWGYYHEFGHNHQNHLWTGNNEVEVTVNIFSVYVMENLVGIPYGDVKSWASYEKINKQMDKYFSTPAHERERGFVCGLHMYMQLRLAFGWEPFKKIFRQYLELPKNYISRKDEIKKRDEWMVRFSKLVKRNLTPFYDIWGVQTSKTAKKSIDHFPEWIPEDLKKYRL